MFPRSASFPKPLQAKTLETKLHADGEPHLEDKLEEQPNEEIRQWGAPYFEA